MTLRTDAVDDMVDAVSRDDWEAFQKKNQFLSKFIGAPVVCGGFTIHRVKRWTPGFYEISYGSANPAAVVEENKTTDAADAVDEMIAEMESIPKVRAHKGSRKFLFIKSREVFFEIPFKSIDTQRKLIDWIAYLTIDIDGWGVDRILIGQLIESVASQFGWKYPASSEWIKREVLHVD